ncbi:alpha-humulene/(-)-(E)-beta-caryophyllene synthase [Eutrema salsugineum]|uniref:alpha-humulene/(-)-(E)-beta-caryophyllene synthase n=1 Tax=Eutrema salsugineum TaxID=72664 RepID=UPI000CED2D96|nr:alpha-humulene/(-)-(E)-beta-caryophyllene synthase [Eutrema salsugineum]
MEESERNKEKLRSLKETVRKSFMASKEEPITNMKFIDVLCRLGVSYHFEHEILEQLESMFGHHDFMQMMRDNEQFGYKLSVDMFDKFKNKDGEFKEHLAEDARGMLCLFEAAHWSTHGEDILDEALSYSRSHLEGLASRSSPHLAVRIKNVLKHAYPRGIPRIETRQYITYYEAEGSHDQTLLQFAKVDFNLLQMQHREELGQVFRWYKGLELDSKLPYARNRVVESYLWAVGAYFEPRLICLNEKGDDNGGSASHLPSRLVIASLQFFSFFSLHHLVLFPSYHFVSLLLLVHSSPSLSSFILLSIFSMDFSSTPYSQPSNFVDLLNSQQDSVFCGTAMSLGEEPAAERKERRTWTPADDVLLISSWLNTSKDAIVGNEQRAGAFWKRVAVYFASCPKPETRELA